jgi:diaminopimelate decarboxylase
LQRINQGRRAAEKNRARRRARESERRGHTHAKITTGTYENKFGIAFEQIEGVYARAAN